MRWAGVDRSIRFVVDIEAVALDNRAAGEDKSLAAVATGLAGSDRTFLAPGSAAAAL